MSEVTYLVFLAVSGVAATLVGVFTAGVVGVLLYSPGGEPRAALKAESAPQANDPHLHSQAA